MELSQLRYFITVAQLQHLTKAAEALNISQPALSKSISRLEEELGQTLFDRSPNRITLNDSGRLYLRYVSQALNMLDSGRNALQSRQEPLGGSVSIMTSCSGILQPAVRKFLTDYPAVRYQQHRYTPGLLAEQLEAGSADFAVSTTPISSVKFSWTPLIQDELYILAAPEHPFYTRDQVTMEELREQPLIISNYILTIHDIVVEGFAKYGMIPRIAYELNNPLLTNQLILENRGVAFVPGIRTDPVPDNQVSPHRLIPVAGHPFAYELGLLHFRGRYQRPAAELFSRFLQEWFQHPGLKGATHAACL